MRIVPVNVFIIVLSVALLLAIGVLVFGFGQIIYGIAHYYWRERKPTRKVQHPRLGMLASEGSLWAGVVRRDGRDIRFLVGGSENAADERLLSQVENIIGSFAESERRAVDFLRNREACVRDSHLDFYMLVVSDRGRPDHFTFEFVERGDDSREWRVEFIAGEPTHTGFDD